MFKKVLLILLVLFSTSCSSNNENRKESKMPESIINEKIKLNINGEDFTVTLIDNESTRALLKMFPLEINMKELNNNEKYYYLENDLPNNPSKIGDIKKGDLMLYNSDCLVLFYESFETSYSYTPLGKIDNPNSLDSLMKDSEIKVLFTKQNEVV